MAHRTSAAAHNLACTILKEYSLVVRPPDTLVSGRIDKLQNTDGHVAIIIDYATNVFEIANLRPEVRYWQQRLSMNTATAPQIANFFQKILEAFAKLPQDKPDEIPPTQVYQLPHQFGATAPIIYTMTRASREATRFIFHYYDVTPRAARALDDAQDRFRITKLAEGCLGISRAMRLVPEVETELKRLSAGESTASDIRKCMRTVGVLLEYLPNYENREEESKLLV